MKVEKKLTQGIFIINPATNETIIEITGDDSCDNSSCGACDECILKQTAKYGYVTKRFIRSTTLIIEGGDNAKVN